MNKEEKVEFLELKNLNWLEIAEILNITYEEVRNISEGMEFKHNNIKDFNKCVRGIIE